MYVCMYVCMCMHVCKIHVCVCVCVCVSFELKSALVAGIHMSKNFRSVLDDKLSN